MTRARDAVPSGFTPEAKAPRAEGVGRHHDTSAAADPFPPLPDYGSLEDDTEYGSDMVEEGWIRAQGKGGRWGKKNKGKK